MASFLPPKPQASEEVTPTPEQLVNAREYENEAFRRNEERIRMEQLSQLRLSDPEMYEELVAKGELEHAGEESDRVDAG